MNAWNYPNGFRGGLSPLAVVAWLLLGSLAWSAAACAQSDTIFEDGFELAPTAVPISPDPNYTGSDSHVVVGSDGVVHMVYSGAADSNDDNGPVRYGQCASNCMVAANWHFLTLGLYGSSALAGGVRIALTSAGAPRVWWYRQSQVSGTGSFYYAVCNANCSSPSAWTAAPIKSFANQTINDSVAGSPTHSPFGLDSAGHPHYFAQLLSGVFYASCTSHCTQSGQWSYVSFNVDFIGTAEIDLAFSGTTPLFVEQFPGPVSQPGNFLAYGGYNGSNWVNSAIFEPSTNDLLAIPMSLAVTSGGAPRVAFYQVDNQGAGVYKMVYGACDSGCDASGFSWIYAGVPASAGFAGLDLQLDVAGHSLIAYSGDPDSSGLNSQAIGLALCTSGCAAVGSSWQNTVIESSSTIPVPIPTLTGADAACVAGSQWYVGAQPSLALYGGTSHVSWDIDFLESCPYGYGGYYTFAVNGPIRYAER